MSEDYKSRFFQHIAEIAKSREELSLGEIERLENIASGEIDVDLFIQPEIARLGSLEIVKNWLNGLDTDDQNPYDDMFGAKALIFAYEEGHLDIVKYLLTQTSPETLLTEASERGYLEIVKYAIDDGADIHTGKQEPFKVATYASNIEIVKYLAGQGADIHVDNDWALRAASHGGSLEMVKYLVEQGLDIHARNDMALTNASKHGHIEVVQYLVEHGANVNTQDDLALRLASHNGFYQICDYLVSQGADPQKVVDDEKIAEDKKQWAIDFVNKRNFANKLDNELAEKSSKADRLVASIDEDAPPPQKQARSTRQKI